MSTYRRNSNFDSKFFVRISKSLSYILRHGAVKENIYMRPDGYVRIRDLLASPRFNTVSFEDIQQVVRDNEKQRFTLQIEEGEWWIKANQGHSLEVVELELETINDPGEIPVLIHGTSLRAWESIQKTGLSKMSRQHIHMATGLPGDNKVISGMRKSSEVFIFIDAKKAMADGIVFLRSPNGVILTSGKDGQLPKEYFTDVRSDSGSKIPFMRRTNIKSETETEASSSIQQSSKKH